MRRQISIKHQNHDLNGRVTSFNFAKNPHLQSRQARPFFSAFSSAFLPFFISAAHLKELSPAVRLTLQLFFPSSTSHHTHNTPPLYLSSYLPNQQAREQQSHRNKNSNHVVHAQRSPKAQSQRARPTTRTSEMGSFGKTQGGSYIPPSCRLIITITIWFGGVKRIIYTKKRQLE